MSPIFLSNVDDVRFYRLVGTFCSRWLGNQFHYLLFHCLKIYTMGNYDSDYDPDEGRGSYDADEDIGMMYEDRDDLLGLMVRGFILYDE